LPSEKFGLMQVSPDLCNESPDRAFVLGRKRALPHRALVDSPTRFRAECCAWWPSLSAALNLLGLVRVGWSQLRSGASAGVVCFQQNGPDRMSGMPRNSRPSLCKSMLFTQAPRNRRLPDVPCSGARGVYGNTRWFPQDLPRVPLWVTNGAQIRQDQCPAGAVLGRPRAAA
jgi:hypothetical protein